MIKDITRREFITTATIATGFVAVQPVSAKAIATDAKELVAAAVKRM